MIKHLEISPFRSQRNWPALDESSEAFVSQPPPEASSSEVIGLLDYLYVREGREDVLQIAARAGWSSDRAVAVVKAAELLGFVGMLGRLVVLEPEGRRFLQSSPSERTYRWRKRLLRQRCFREVHDALRMRPGGRIGEEIVLQILSRCAYQSDYERSLKAFVDWGRRGGLFTYKEDTRFFSVV
jgi:hypothetical protein